MKKEEMLSGYMGNIQESMGVFRRGGTPAAGGAGPRAVPADQVGRERARDVWTIDVDRIAPDPDQPRKEFDPEALERLAESIRTRGQLQPIQVRWSEALGRFVVLMGERRWRAAQMAGLKSMACVVREGDLSDDDKLSIQLVENCLREDLSPIDQAKAFRSLMERQEWSQHRLASELAISQGAVAKALALLRLPDSIQTQVERGGLSPSLAIEIAKVDDPAEQIRLATTAAEQRLTRDDVAKQVRKAPAKKRSPGRIQTTAVLRLNGYRIEISRKSGIDAATLYAALMEAAEKYRPGPQAAGEAA